jgi:2-polyprenyl-3-methyl-5-hydroxy-6-metoxy-1,4-benzoquinol methylase
MPCKLCGNTAGNTPYRVREMLLGTRDEFDYFQCGKCDCLQITAFPENMDKYYPNTYYSFSELEEAMEQSPLKRVKNALVRSRDMYAITGRGVLGSLLYTMRPFTELRGLSKHRISKHTSILDVGCGSGHYLYKLKRYGFDNLLGVDPYIKEDIRYENGLTVKKGELSDVEGKFDIIMLHHSLEHMEKQKETLAQIFAMLENGGMCLIRIPTVSSLPWKTYRENWVHMDPPRHFFLHSHESISMLAKEAGFSVESITSDATPFSFYGSEFYKRGIPATEWTEDAFSKSERRAFDERTEDMNNKNRGDTIAVILRKHHEHA